MEYAWCIVSSSTNLSIDNSAILYVLEYIQMFEQGDMALAVDGDEEDEDAEDDEIRATDSLLVVAITEDEYSHLEVI